MAARPDGAPNEACGVQRWLPGMSIHAGDEELAPCLHEFKHLEAETWLVPFLGIKMAFERDEVSDLLARCHRRCCVCHRFCGVKMETDHIIPTEDGGDDSIENAIPVCFECHAEIHSYNDSHPRGRKFGLVSK